MLEGEKLKLWLWAFRAMGSCWCSRAEPQRWNRPGLLCLVNPEVVGYSHEEKEGATELKNQQIPLFYLIYSRLWLQYRQHLLEGGEIEHFYWHCIQIIFSQLELNHQPSRHHLKQTTCEGSTGLKLKSGSEDKTPWLEITLCHIINLTHFTLLIIAVMRARHCIWHTNMMK